MSNQHNEEIIKNIYLELSQGNARPFMQALSEEVVWKITGSSKWSKTFKGKDKVQLDLINPLFSNFKTRYSCRANKVYSSGDFVIVVAQGNVITHEGNAYNNQYCYIFRLEDQMITEIIEYGDTALIDRVLTIGS